MNKFINAAIEILNDVKKPLHYKDITKLALNKGIFQAGAEKNKNSTNYHGNI